jgi:hypothetical protein
VQSAKDEPSAAGFVATHTTAAIEIDGALDEAAWQAAEVVALAYETQPGENRLAPIATACRVLYDSERLYVGCIAEDPDPETIRARFTDRDQAYDGDFVGVRLDPFLDRRRAFEFYVNPLGVQMDLFRDDLAAERQGGDDGEDTSWDALWDSAGRITAAGYEVELAIPVLLAALPHRRWSADLGHWLPPHPAAARSPRARERAVRPQPQLRRLPALDDHGLRRDHSRPPPRARSDADGAAGGAARGGSGRPARNAGGRRRARIDRDLGRDARHHPLGHGESGLLPGRGRRAGARRQPAVRDFLSRATAVLSRRRGPLHDSVSGRLHAQRQRPRLGAKVTGKRGASAFGAFVAEDTRTSLLVPGSERSELAELPVASTDAVVRYRRDLGTNSALGVVATSRKGGDYSNQVAGFDGLFRLGAVDSLRFQALGSRTEYPAEIAAAFDQPAGSLEDHALFFSYNRDARDWRLSAAYEDIGRDFRADMGFLPQVDRRYGKALAERTWWAAPDARWLRFSLGVDSARTDDQRGEPLERLDEIWFIFRGRREANLFAQLADRERTIGGRHFDELYLEGQAGLRPSGALEVHLGWKVGDDVDLEQLRPADQVTLSPGLTWEPGRHLRAELEHRYQRLSIDDGWLFTAQLTELRLVWQFNLRSFVRVILQHRDLARDPDLYEAPVDARSRRLFQ